MTHTKTNSVTILLVGMRPRYVASHPEESLSQLIKRLRRFAYPLDRVDNWYVNGNPTPASGELVVRSGDIIAGCPRVY